ncbi:hypothetical protein BKA62DRAFT_699648 [Auriculariales sp. MPI-PUGE-AT-0066]|nr:hypothetical protein BKA62DRAFT_699648 [Auriculariales sp. MPI-PUGE-AT-0066]
MQTTLHQFQTQRPKGETNRDQRAKIAAESLDAIKAGFYAVGTTSYALAPSVQATVTGTLYEPPTSPAMAGWRSKPGQSSVAAETTFDVRQTTTLEALRRLAKVPAARVGVLNFASAHKPGGGFLSGAQAQEESLARSSTIYSSLMSQTGQLFYSGDRKEPGYYSHAMLWTPAVTFFRDDAGHWLAPCSACVVTSAAVNAGAVKSKLPDNADRAEADARIRSAMHERMARILCLFERQGSSHIVLGSFGTGVFKNNVETVAQLWAELLGPGSRYQHVFQHIEFAILDEITCSAFKDAFIHRCGELWLGLTA